MAYVYEAFGEERTVTIRLWPPRSPGLSTCNFYLWGNLKAKVYSNNPHTIEKEHSECNCGNHTKLICKSCRKHVETCWVVYPSSWWTVSASPVKYWMFCTLFLIITMFHRARWLRGNVRDSHLGGPGFKSRCRPTWLSFFRGFPQSLRQMLGWIFITTIYLTIIHKIDKS